LSAAPRVVSVIPRVSGSTRRRAGIRVMPSRLLLLIASCALATFAPSARAQGTSSSDEPVCLGFAFGTWTPRLDWKGAGHGEMPSAGTLQRAPSGRDWATDGGAGLPDTLLILYPGWWPAGVRVDLPTRSPASGDTVTGRAVAFVANGELTPPVARVRAWRVSCGAR
jgi:hypothetical protein